MNLRELSNLNASVAVMVSLPDLREFFAELVAEAAAKPVEEEKYLGVPEVCELLNVSANTLWRWNRSGYLHSIKVGRSPMYRLSDINNLRQGNK